MQSASSSSSANNRRNNNNINAYNNDSLYPHSSSLYQRNKQLLERFLASIRSDVTREGVLSYIKAYMRYCHLYEEGLKEEGGEGHHQEQDLLINLDHDVLGNNKKRKKKKNDNNNIVYRYDWLVNDDVETIQNKIIDFVIDRKKEGLLGAKGIDNYINPLEKFYKVNGIKGIDWELIRSYKPDDVKKTQDREYYPEEVIAIEEKLDVRGKVVSGVMRGSGIRRGAEPLIKVGDLIPIQTKRYGKIYKIIVDRGTPDMYTTACIPEIAKRIDDYFEYRIRFGEVCKLYEKKSDHKHEYHDGDQWFEISYKADDKHLDPDAPS